MTVFFYNRHTKKYAHNTADSIESAIKFGLSNPQRKKDIKVTKIKGDEFRTNTAYDLHVGEVGYRKHPPRAFIIFRGEEYEFPTL